MKFLSFVDAAGRPRAGVIDPDDDSIIRDLTEAVPDGPGSPMRRVINASGGRAAAAEPLIATAPTVRRDTTTPLPVVPDPTKIVAAPVNYRDHQAEMSQDAHIDALGVFLKAPSSVIADGDTVRLPYTDRRFDQEGEFAAVIGRRARNVDQRDALSYVFGYTCLLDMTMRGGEDRSVRKSFDTFTPVGPTISDPAAVGPIDELELHLWVNGDLRQRADLSDLIWTVPRLIAYVSTVMTLNPGDIVTTGTPEGVGQVNDGDRIAMTVTGLDRLSVVVSDVDATVCPTRGGNRGPKPPEHLTPVSERIAR